MFKYLQQTCPSGFSQQAVFWSLVWVTLLGIIKCKKIAFLLHAAWILKLSFNIKHTGPSAKKLKCDKLCTD